MSEERSLPALLLRGALQLGISAALLGGGYVGLKVLGARQKKPARRPDAAQLPLVEVARVAPHEGPLEIELGGVVRPWRELRLTAEVAGRLVEKHAACRPGRQLDPASAPVLFRIDDADYQLACRQAREQLIQAEQARADHQTELANVVRMIALRTKELELRQREVERQLGLGDVTSQAAVEVAKQQALAAQVALMAADNQRRMLASGPRLKLLDSAVAAAKARLEGAELDLARCAVRTPPAGGRVVAVAVEEGAFVARGQLLATLEDTTRAEVRCLLRMDDLRLVWNQRRTTGEGNGHGATTDVPRTPAEVRVSIGEHEVVWDATLERLDGDGVDERTRMVPAVVVIDSPGNARGDAPHVPPLLRGLWVTVRLKLQPAAALLAVPDRAVRPGGQVWVVDGGALRARQVAIVRRSGGFALVAVGGQLAAGEQVVVSPLGAPVEGMAVEISRP